MTNFNAAAATVLASYLLGAVPFALLLGRLKGVDIRTTGSGNIGATNLSRALGRSWGIAAFLLDFLKGFLPVLAAGWLSWGSLEAVHVQIACALAAVLGHVFPVWLRFRGGKGVATTFGVVTAILPLAALAAGGVWLVLFAATRTVSIASIAAAAAFPAAAAAASWQEPAPRSVPVVALALVIAAIVVARHRSNIRRLLAGKENRF